MGNRNLVLPLKKKKKLYDSGFNLFQFSSLVVFVNFQFRTKHTKNPKTKLNNLYPVILGFVYTVPWRMSQ